MIDVRISENATEARKYYDCTFYLFSSSQLSARSQAEAGPPSAAPCSPLLAPASRSCSPPYMFLS